MSENIIGANGAKRGPGETFLQKMQVSFCMCTAQKVLSMHELYKITSDIAVEDFNTQGFSRDFLAERGFAILVSRSSFHIHRSPRENEHIIVSTQEEKPEVLQFVRGFDFTSESGEKLITGYSTWIIIDVVARRILPIKRFDFNTRPTTVRDHECLPCGKISVGEDAKLLFERAVEASDIDANGHMNNSRYPAFMVNAMSDDLLKKTVTDIRLNYAHEAMKGELLSVYGKDDPQAHKFTVKGVVEGKTSFEGEIIYK